MIEPVIFIPCYNASETIRETVESVMIAISETNRTIPVYIFDDCSRDNSIEILQSFSNKFPGLNIVINESNMGERRTTNRAAEILAENYDWMFIIHADDIVKPDWLTTMLSIIEKNNGDHFFTVWSSFDSLEHKTGVITEGDNSGEIHIKKRSQKEIADYLIRLYSSWHLSGAAVNLKLYLDLNGFDEGMAQFGDTDFFVRGLMKGLQDIYISRTLTKYRIITMSVSSVSFKTNRDIREVYLLLKKYDTVLDKSEKKRLLQHCFKTTLKRTIKAFGNLQVRLGISNGREMIHALKCSWQHK